MKNEFVPYDIALAMKELGFDEPCIASFYNADDSGNEESSSIPWMKLGFYMEKKPKSNKHWESIGEEVISAPLYQQAFRWFREKHGIFSWLTRHRYNITTSLGNKEYYRWGLEYEVETSEPHINSEIVYPGKEYDTYEEVELACLEKLIEIVNQNKEDE